LRKTSACLPRGSDTFLRAPWILLQDGYNSAALGYFSEDSFLVPFRVRYSSC
jgi:hypothetical protein